MPGIVQAPLTFRVGSTIVRGGSYPPPYRVINLSVKASIWVSSNPGMSPGQGTILNPGTSFTWTRGEDIYFILGDDVLSTDVGYADVIISYDVGDWQPDPVAIASAALNRQEGSFTVNSLVGANDIVIDASLFSTLICQFTPAATYPDHFRISWYYTLAEAEADTGLFWQDQWVFAADPDSGHTPGFSIQVPCRSPYLRLSGDGTVSYALNSRPVSDIRYCVNNDFGDVTTFDGTLLQVVGGAVAAGAASATHWLDMPYTGDVDIYGRVSGAAPPNGQVRITENAAEIDIRGMTAAFVQVVNTAGIAFRTSFTSRQVGIRLVNNSAGAVAWTNYIIFVKAVTAQYRGN